MVYFVYILQSEANLSFYKGSTDNLVRRLDQHNAGKNFSTMRFVPWRLVWYTVKETKSDAVRLEMKLKNLLVQRTIEFMKKYPSPQVSFEVHPWVQP